LQRILDDYGDAIRRDFPRHWRRASGYNLDKLLLGRNPQQGNSPGTPPNLPIAGSEGTLAFMTEMTLRAVPRPARTALAMVHFDDLVAAAEATPFLLELHPSAIELMDKLLLDLCRQQPAYGQRLTFVEGDPACVLAVEFYVDSEAEGRARLDGLRAQLAAHGHHGAVVPCWTRRRRPTPGPCARPG
jgi:FAD/FMN-containing dehydrogenase